MDSFIFIGYRIDVDLNKSKAPKDEKRSLDHYIPDCDYLPGQHTYLHWNHISGGDSYLYRNQPYRYYCPLAGYALQEVLDKETIDLPPETVHRQTWEAIRASPAYQRLLEHHGGEAVTIKYGIFKGHG